MAGSTQVRFELPNDGANKIRHLIERFKNRLALDNLRISERYVKSELDVLVRFVPSVFGNSNDFIAHYHRHPETKGTRSHILGSLRPQVESLA